MEIRINGSLRYGPSWKDLERLIDSMIGRCERGRLVRISRRDGDANYRASHGVYDLVFRPGIGDETAIVLYVNQPYPEARTNG